MIVVGNLDHGRQLAKSVRSHFNPECDRCITRVENGVLLGGVIYQNYTGRDGSIGIHVAAYQDRWINPDMLWITFHYPFVQLGCKKLFGQVPETNQKALDFDLRLGFRMVTFIEDVFPDGGLYVISMDRDDCRWLKLRPRTLKAGGS